MSKIGKDVLNKKSSAILQTKKDRIEYEEYKRRKAAEEEEGKQKKEKKLIKSRMTEDREPTPEELAKQKEEVFAGMRKFRIKKVVLKEEE